MDNLLSGFLGAIVGAIVTGMYQAYIEANRAKIECAADTIDTIENMYHLSMLLTELGQEPPFQEERKENLHRFLNLVTSHSGTFKLELAFRDDVILDHYQKLVAAFRKIAMHISSPDICTKIYSEEVTPHYQDLLNALKQVINRQRLL